MANRLLLAIGDFLTIYLYRYMHGTFYELRPWVKRHRLLFALLYLTDWLLLLGANLMELPPLNLASAVAAFFLPLFAGYRVRDMRGIAYYLFYMVGTLVAEIVLGVGLGYFSSGMTMETQYDIITPQVSVSLNLAELVLVLCICKFGSREKGAEFERVTLLFMIMPLLSLGLIVTDVLLLAMGKLEGFNPGQFMNTALLLLVVNVALFIILKKYTELMKRDLMLAQEKLKLQSDADIMTMAAKTMQERLQIMEQAVGQDRLMRHDRRHFEAVLLSLLREGETEEAVKCLEERLAVEPRAALRYCEEPAVNAAIGHYVSWAECEGIRTEVSANIPERLRVDALELAITVSNLLENAVYACMKVPERERYIRLTARYRTQLLLEIENACAGPVPLDADGCPYSTEEGHGVGTRSVRAFANRTDSELIYNAEAQRFRVRMII